MNVTGSINTSNIFKSKRCFTVARSILITFMKILYKLYLDKTDVKVIQIYLSLITIFSGADTESKISGEKTDVIDSNENNYPVVKFKLMFTTRKL